MAKNNDTFDVALSLLNALKWLIMCVYGMKNLFLYKNWYNEFIILFIKKMRI